MSMLRMNADDVVQMFGLLDILHIEMQIYSSVNLSRILSSPFNIDIQTVAADPSASVEFNVAVCNLSTTLDYVLLRITKLENTILSDTVLPATSTAAVIQKSSTSSSSHPTPQIQQR